MNQDKEQVNSQNNSQNQNKIPSQTSESQGVKEKQEDGKAKQKQPKASSKGMQIKCPKGARDIQPSQMRVRKEVIQIVEGVFKRFGGEEIQTPVFELKETLTGKYGEDSKLIYDIADQGGELLSLRYDLTVPLARYVAEHGIKKLRRFQIANVYRRDAPQMNRGRFREFMQCDLDIIGEEPQMMPDSDIIACLNQALIELQIGQFEIKINHRKLLDGMLEISGVPSELFRPICSAIDKLDKEPWEVVKKEMIQKQISESTADKIGEFVKLKSSQGESPSTLVQQLSSPDHPFQNNASTKKGLEDLQILFNNLENMQSLDNVRFDLSLARGLDYYTGLVTEATLVGGNVGSIAGGGRYDELVGIFGNRQVPAVGMSMGIERIMAIYEEQKKQALLPKSDVDVYVITQGSKQNSLKTLRLQLASEFRRNGVSCMYSYKEVPKFLDQIKAAENLGVKYAIIVGEQELQDDQLQVKEIQKSGQSQEPTILKVNRNKLVETVKGLLNEKK